MSDTFTLKAVLGRTTTWHPGNVAFIENEEALTYRDLNRRSRRLAHGLASLGVVPADRVLFLLPSSLDLVVAYWACVKAGAVPVPLLARESADYHVNVARRLSPRLILAAPASEERARTVAAALVPSPAVVLLTAGPSPGPTLATLEATGADAEPAVVVGERDPAVMSSTSGSTGRPKLVARSHLSTVEYGRASLYNRPGIRDSDRTIMPFDASFSAWMTTTIAFVTIGGGVILMSQWDPERYWWLAERHRATILYAGPTMWRQLVAAHPERYDLSAVWLVTTVAEQMTAELLEEITGRVHPHLSQIYGLSEITGTVAWAAALRRKGITCIGKPMLHHDARVIRVGGAPDEELSNGETGELILTGPSMLTEYWGDQELTAQRIRGGWYYTGDLARRDDDADLFYAGRVDGVVNSGGLKVSPEEVEGVLARHPSVREVVVVGVPDARWGQRLEAVVVATARGVDTAELDRWCSETAELAAFKRPRRYHVLDALPRLPGGKIDRKRLAVIAAEASGSGETL